MNVEGCSHEKATIIFVAEKAAKMAKMAKQAKTIW